MTLYCAYEDFVQRTLAAVPGTWGKLRYLSALRRPGGGYEHWGMLRTYGQAAAHSAIEEAHRAVLRSMLRMPVRELLTDAQKSAAAAQLPLLVFLQQLTGSAEGLLPGNMGGAAARHFNSVLEALLCLAQAGKDASLPVSSQSQLPAPPPRRRAGGS